MNYAYRVTVVEGNHLPKGASVEFVSDSYRKSWDHYQVGPSPDSFGEDVRNAFLNKYGNLFGDSDRLRIENLTEQANTQGSSSSDDYVGSGCVNKISKFAVALFVIPLVLGFISELLNCNGEKKKKEDATEQVVTDKENSTGNSSNTYRARSKKSKRKSTKATEGTRTEKPSETEDVNQDDGSSFKLEPVEEGEMPSGAQETAPSEETGETE